jgi:hypothetical protein
VALCFPAYRPELVDILARDLGYRLIDFRKARMAPLGWQAASLPLAALVSCAAEEMQQHDSPLVLQNSESLLAVHPAPARRAALARLLNISWPQRLILPLALYAMDTPNMEQAVYKIEASHLPEESLLVRLAGMK